MPVPEELLHAASIVSCKRPRITHVNPKILLFQVDGMVELADDSVLLFLLLLLLLRRHGLPRMPARKEDLCNKVSRNLKKENKN